MNTFLRSLGLLALFTVFTLSTTTLGWSDEPATSGVWDVAAPIGAQVRVDAQTKGVSVTLKRDKDQIPQSIGITFISASGKRYMTELKAVDRMIEAGAPEAQFSGSLSPNAASFIGFEIQIPFQLPARKKSLRAAPTILRSNQMTRVR